MNNILQRCALSWNAPFLGLLLIFLYTYAFQATKPSPLLHASVEEHVLVIVQLLGVAAILAMTYAGAAGLTRKLFGRTADIVLRVVVVIVLSVFLMMAVENFMYTLLGKGMKSTDLILLRALVAFAAIRAAMDIYRLPQKWAKTLSAGAWLVPLLAMTSFFYLAWGFSDTSRLEVIEPATDLPNILILSSDGIDANHMSVYGYARETTPFLSSKVAEFALFENAYTNNANTTGSVVSFLSGTSPSVNGVVYPPDILRGEFSIRGLPQLLGELGYRRSSWGVAYYSSAQSQNMIGAFDLDNGSRLFPVLSHFLPQSYELSRWLLIGMAAEAWDMARGVFLMQPFDNPFNIVTEHHSYAQDAKNIEGVLQELDRSEPVFVNTHFMMTHGAFFVVREPYFSKGRQQAEPWDPDFYDDSIRDFDAVVSQIYQHLEESGELDNTVLIITSDHGSRWSKLQRIPLMIRFPDSQFAGKHGGMAQRMDVAPTLLKYIGQPVPAWMTGQSLMEPLSCERTIYAYGILQKIAGASATNHTHIGSAKLFDNHSLSLLRNGSATTINSTILQIAGKSTDRQKTLRELAEVEPLDGSC